MNTPTCPSCGGRDLYRARRPVNSGGGYAPNYLPGLGNFLRCSAKFEVVVCQSCGLTRFFASAAAREKLPASPKWERVSEDGRYK